MIDFTLFAMSDILLDLKIWHKNNYIVAKTKFIVENCRRFLTIKGAFKQKSI
jgi:hypothetical protein